MAAAQVGRLRQALAAELPAEDAESLDEALIEHLAAQLGGDDDEDSLAEAWSPFLQSLGACSDDEGALEVCRRLLARLRAPDPGGGGGATSSSAGGGSGSGSGGGATSSSQPPASPPESQPQHDFSADLTAWLERLHLGGYAEQARLWCKKNGAVSLAEVFENWEEFADELKLKVLEKRRVGKDIGMAVSKAARGGGTDRPPEPVPTPGPDPAPPPAIVPVSGGNYFGPPEDPKKYTILEKLGEGATASVHKCMRGNEVYAVKTVSLAKLRLQQNFQQQAASVRREVSILFSLKHPRIVTLFDVVELPDRNNPRTLHIVMELVEGGELFDKIAHKGAFKESEARYVFLQIAEGLQYIHSKGIVYRDLKPENILVDEKASRPELLEIKLSDFGHSKLINDGYSTALTRVGTPQYWAPEVSDSVRAAQGYDQKVDLWSLGVVLYVMLIGAYPFVGATTQIQDEMIRKAKFEFPRHGRDITDSAKDLIKSLIKVRPADRLPLDRCLVHQWVDSTKKGVCGRLVKTETEADGKLEERIPLPAVPSREQVERLRNDLYIWMTKFHCYAVVANHEITAQLGSLGALGSPQIENAREDLRKIVEFNFGTGMGSARAPPQSRSSGAGGCGGYPGPLPAVREEVGGGGGKGRGRPHRYVPHTLRVSAEHGAGLDLQAERGGMRVTRIYDQPGQPGLSCGDLIMKINEVSLRGTLEQVEEMFGAHFGDGAQLQVKR